MTNKIDMQEMPRASYGPAVLAPCQKRNPDNNIKSPSTSLSSKLVGDAVVGTSVTFLMAPFLTVVDKAIAQRAAGTHTLAQSSMQTLQSIMKKPTAFVRNPAFLYVWAVYASTYTTANSLKTLVEHQEKMSPRRFSLTQETVNDTHQQDQAALGKIGIFLGTSVANSGASVMKDRKFAYMFSPQSASRSSVARTVPIASYGLWMSRDLIGVGSSFVLPDLIARKLSSNPEDMKLKRDVAQFCVPIATQLVAGPLHLLGLDLFNRPMQALPVRQRLVERVAFLANGYTAVVGARVARIIPGYGFGGVLNSNLRDGWREYLLERDTTESSTQISLSSKLGTLVATVRTCTLDVLSRRVSYSNYLVDAYVCKVKCTRKI